MQEPKLRSTDQRLKWYPRDSVHDFEDCVYVNVPGDPRLRELCAECCLTVQGKPFISTACRAAACNTDPDREGRVLRQGYYKSKATMVLGNPLVDA